MTFAARVAPANRMAASGIGRNQARASPASASRKFIAEPTTSKSAPPLNMASRVSQRSWRLRRGASAASSARSAAKYPRGSAAASAKQALEVGHRRLERQIEVQRGDRYMAVGNRFEVGLVPWRLDRRR